MKSSRPKKNPISTRRYLWQVIQSALAHGSMPCWALPFEAIAASMLLRDRTHKKKPKPQDPA